MATLRAPTLLSYEEYLRSPEIKRRFEIIDGVLIFMAPTPNLFHQDSVGELHVLMRRVSRGHGKVVLAPFDIIVRRQPLRTRQPDLFYVKNERLDVLRDRMDAGPDVVVEVLSPSNTRKAVHEKLADYASIGVKECWMVDLDRRRMEIWRNEAGVFRPIASYRPGQKVRSREFPVFILPAAVFPPK